MSGQWGEDFIPDRRTVQNAVTVDQFDRAFYADLHSVVESDVSLLGVEFDVRFDLTRMEVGLTDPDTDCIFNWSWEPKATLLANASVGTGDILLTIPEQGEQNIQISAGAGVAYSWDLIVDGPGVQSISRCTGITSNLNPWIGSGQISWDMFFLSIPQIIGCGNADLNRNIEGRAVVSVKYIYCISDTPPPPVNCTGEGCTPGYWKNHEERWDDQGNDDFTNTIKHFLSFNGVLGVTEAQSGKADSVTLHDAASTGGGGLNALGRHTAAALASSDTAMHYAYSLAGVIDLYRDAVGADAGPETVQSVHGLLEDANEAGCPLSNDYQGSSACIYCDANEGDCPCGGSSTTGGCRNSTGQGAALSTSGSTSHAADDLVITASQLPPNTVVIWIAAVATNREVLGDGLLCLSEGNLKIIRSLVTTASPGGVSTFGPGIVQMSIDNPVAAAEIFPGTTWNFQAYYRDLASTCGGMSNLSNAAQVTFD